MDRRLRGGKTAFLARTAFTSCNTNCRPIGAAPIPELIVDEAFLRRRRLGPQGLATPAKSSATLLLKAGSTASWNNKALAGEDCFAVTAGLSSPDRQNRPLGMGCHRLEPGRTRPHLGASQRLAFLRGRSASLLLESPNRNIPGRQAEKLVTLVDRATVDSGAPDCPGGRQSRQRWVQDIHWWKRTLSPGSCVIGQIYRRHTDHSDGKSLVADAAGNWWSGPAVIRTRLLLLPFGELE
jgi:hypothetical protein